MLKKLIASVRSWGKAKWDEGKAASRMHQPTKLGVLGIMKNEATNIDEWVEHYLWMGAGKIYLIDNGSTDDTVAKAKAWVAKGLVQLVRYPGKHQQVIHYRAAVRHFGIVDECEWLLIADMDEFWFCPSGDTLAEAMKEFRRCDVVYSNWVIFGSGGLIEQPTSVREGFTLRKAALGSHFENKYRCRTHLLQRPGSLQGHRVHVADTARTVSDTHILQLNHYQIQSESFFRSVKMQRGGAMMTSFDTLRDMKYFRRVDEGCDQEDRTLADLVAAARNR